MPTWFPHNLADVALFTPLRIVFLIVVALIARYVLQRLIDRAVRQAIGHHLKLQRFRPTKAFLDVTAPASERREQRISALGSISRSATTLVIFTVVALMILAELGFNVTTIVAGTSVVAVTLSFGLQSIVKDLVSGVFMLVEDQIGVGDWVDMERASGTVEEIGLRVTQLRDPDGTVWYVRNGEVLRVGNFSQGGSGRPAPEPVAEPS